jgi:hypothetical protein
LKLKLDEAADALEWPALVAETRKWLDALDTTVNNRHGSSAERDKAFKLADESKDIIAGRKMDRLARSLAKSNGSTGKSSSRSPDSGLISSSHWKSRRTE